MWLESAYSLVYEETLKCLQRLKLSHICVIDQACSVKMAGYWPRSFFAFLRTETQKKNEANIQPS